MELKWLEDYLALTETRSFSKAAQRRHVSQPAFSRRIQALEDWLGVTLVDRSRKPLQMTPLALENEAELRSIVNRFHELRGQLKAEEAGEQRLTLAVQHSLAAAFLPSLLRQLQDAGLRHPYRLRSANKGDCVSLLMKGEADLLLCYDAVQATTRLPAASVRRLELGSERLLLVSAAGANGEPLFGGRNGRSRQLPLIAYPQTSFLGKLLWEERLPDLVRRYDVEMVCISAFTFAVRGLALSGLGVAWLPESLIGDDIAAGLLVPLNDLAAPCPMSIAVYAPHSAAGSAIDRAWMALGDIHGRRDPDDLDDEDRDGRPAIVPS